MGGSSGGGATTTNTVQKSDPWAPIQPYLLQIAGQASQLPNRPYFPFKTVFPYSDPSQQYMAGLTQRAEQGSPEYNAASAQLTDTLNGAYLGGNPYADATFGQAASAVQNQIDAAMARSGRGLNTGTEQSLLTSQLGDLANQFYFQNYANERQNQINALTQAPNVQQMGLTDLSGLQTVGQAIEAKQYETAQDAQNRWNYYWNQPYQDLADKASIIQGIGGNYGTQTSSGYGTQPAVGVDSTSQIIGGLGTVAGIAALAM